jgi:hypothetical protein
VKQAAIVFAVSVGVAVIAMLVQLLRKPRSRSAAPGAGIAVVTRPTSPATRPKFQPGQVWTYRTRPGEKASRLTILRVEPYGSGTAVHVYVSGVSIINPAAPKGKSTFISHMPFTEEAIDKSVLQLVDQSEQLPRFEEGYATWKEQADQGKAGVFTVGVAEAIEGIAGAFKGNRRTASRQ